ncbi:telomere repeats-binding bouquet formation protein 1 [Trichonephila clavipes]|nr:telomere repeats-binding bouquet formation protein 1 [Trichonephila clavipes]
MKTRYDTKATGHQFKEGDKVWFYNPTRRKGLSQLQSHWDGPYTILKIINDVVIRIHKCQDYFSSCDGFLVLKRCLQKFFDAVFMDLKLCNVIGRENLQVIGSLIAIISAASLNHEKNATLSGKLGILSMMIKLIFVENLDGQLKTKIVLCLGHCIDAFSDNKSYVLETENFDTFLKKSFSIDDAELSSACKYLLHVCLINKGFSEADENFAEYFDFAPTGSMKEICIPESNFVSFDGSTVLNKAQPIADKGSSALHIPLLRHNFHVNVFPLTYMNCINASHTDSQKVKQRNEKKGSEMVKSLDLSTFGSVG